MIVSARTWHLLSVIARASSDWDMFRIEHRTLAMRGRPAGYDTDCYVIGGVR